MTTSAATSRKIETALVVAALLLVVWFYHWIVRANHGFEDWGDQDYYRLLVRGWKKGQLALDKAPAPELLALADPYDPKQNGPYRLGDASFFRGKYYLYFGAAPAFTLMLPYSLLTGRELGTGAAVFGFCAVALGAASALWLAMRRRYFPSSGIVMAPVGVLALGFGSHLLALLQRPSFWELSIAAGAAFTLLALVGVYWALHGRRQLLAMLGAGLALGLAVASRPTCLVAAPMLLAPIWLAWRERNRSGMPSWWRMAMAAGLPLGLCGLAMMAHNHARFGNVFEFGQHYQLSGAYEGRLVHFSPRFLPHNFAVYFFQPVRWTWAFPFVAAQGIEVDIPGYFGTEEVCGVAATFPILWFVLGLPLAWSGRPDHERRAWSATLLALAGGLGPIAGLLLSYFSTTARYQADFAAMVGILALTGMLAVERAAQRAHRGVVAVRLLAVLLGLTTTVMGMLVSFDYHGRALSRTRSELWEKIEHRAHFAIGNVGLRLGRLDGPRVLKVRFKSQPAGSVETFWQAENERILIEHIGVQLIRFGYSSGGAAVEWGRPLRWEKEHTHTVEVQLPGLYRSPEGWMRGLRSDLEFRERSCAAVWFSGGCALSLIVDEGARRAGGKSGGATGRDFSGRVLNERTRLFRDEDLPDEFHAASAVNEPRGGTLRLRLVLPEQFAPEGEPLFAAGAHYGSDIVFVRAAKGGFKIGCEHYGSPPLESPVLPLSRGTHVIEIELPSCRRGDGQFGAYATGDVVVRYDGMEVIHARQPCYGFGSGSERIGANPFGTTCAARFRGWITEARWVESKADAP